MLLLLLPICLFILYPVVRLIQASLTSDGQLSLHHYRSILPAGFRLLKNSVGSSALSAVLSTILAAAVSLHIASVRPWLRRVFMAILLLTMVSPPFVNSLSYILLYGRRGWITHGLLGLSISPYNAWGVVLMQTLSFASLNALLLVGMLDKVDKHLPQTARDLGASGARSFVNIVLPLIRPGIVACLLISFIRGLADFGTPIVVGGRFNTIAAEIYMQITGYASLSKAAALNTLVFLPSLVLFEVYRRMMRQSDTLLGASGAASKLENGIELTGPPRFLAHAVSLFFFVVMLLQYGCVFAGGFVKSIRGQYFFTWEHLARITANEAGALSRSVVYALIVGVAGAVFSLIFAYYVQRKGMPGGGIWDFIATMPMMIPGTCFGIGYILAFAHPPLKLTGTAAIVVLNMMFRQLPSSIRVCAAAVSQIPYALEEAARDLGAGRFKVIIHIILPNLRHAFFTCFVYNFTSAMTTAGAVLFLIQPGQKIAVFRLFDAINMGEYGVASLIATIIILISLAVNLLLMWLTGNGKKGGPGFVFTTGQSS